MVMLKSFQRLGYFIPVEQVPPPIITYLRKCLDLQSSVLPIPSLRSYRYYQVAIRTYLQIRPYERHAQKFAALAVAQAASVMEHPADLINVAIEYLVKERYELPAFSTLDRLVGHVRSIVNTRLFHQIVAKLSPAEEEDARKFSPGSFTFLKSDPKPAQVIS